MSGRYTNFSQKSQNSLQNYPKIIFFSFKLAFHFDWGLKGTWILIQTFSPRLGACSGWVLVQAGHLIEVWVLIWSFMAFSEKYWFEPGTCFILKLEEYGNDHRRHAPITLPF